LSKYLVTHHNSADRLARELEHAPEEGQLVIGKLVLNTEGNKRLELGLAVRDAFVVRAEQVVKELCVSHQRAHRFELVVVPEQWAWRWGTLR